MNFGKEKMTEDDKEFLNEFMRGVAFTFGVIGLLVLFVAIFGTFEETPKEQSNKFKVVDSYKGCDVVQWHYSGLSDYKYFLDCSK